MGLKPVRSNFFTYFWSQEKNQKKFFFQEKSVFFGEKSVFIGKIGYFAPIFFPDFSILISFPAPPKSDFSPKNRPKSVIFLSMVVWND